MEKDIRQLIIEVLQKGYLMSLGIVHEGNPWVSDVIYIFDDELNIYWMSDPDVRHSQAILQNDQVAGTITVSGQGQDNIGIQFAGTAEKIEGPRYDLTVKHYQKRKKAIPGEEVDVLQGDSWYMIKLEYIDLIYEPLYGFTKQKFTLKTHPKEK